jgi:hypothetical protein
MKHIDLELGGQEGQGGFGRRQQCAGLLDFEFSCFAVGAPIFDQPQCRTPACDCLARDRRNLLEVAGLNVTVHQIGNIGQPHSACIKLRGFEIRDGLFLVAPHTPI